MRLTLPQAQRLWQAPAVECAFALDSLVQEGFLGVTEDDAYVALPITTRVRLKPLKAILQASFVRRSA